MQARRNSYYKENSVSSEDSPFTYKPNDAKNIKNYNYKSNNSERSMSLTNKNMVKIKNDLFQVPFCFFF